MSELITACDNRAAIRGKLLTSASALMLAAYFSFAGIAEANNADRPTVWLELGGQMEDMSGQDEIFAPRFIGENPNSPVLQPITPLQGQRSPQSSFGEQGKISFQPKSSDLVFSLSVRYGKSSNFRHTQQQTNSPFPLYFRDGEPNGELDTKVDFADTQAHQQESHALLDFMVGKDLGLGMFGLEGASTFSAGVRIAQFTSKTSVDMRARPDLRLKYISVPPSAINIPYFHTYHATGQSTRSFQGLGPSVSWTGSLPVVGSPQDSEILVDWGINAAVLFGRQKVAVEHKETAHYYGLSQDFGAPPELSYDNPVAGRFERRSVIVPNVGGFAGLSWRLQDFKVSLGYRVDFFFGATDAGIDARKSQTLGFYGPFATIGIGLGG